MDRIADALSLGTIHLLGMSQGARLALRYGAGITTIELLPGHGQAGNGSFDPFLHLTGNLRGFFSP